MAALGVGFTVGWVSFGLSAEVLHVALDKTEILKLEKPASIVLVGTPEIADVTVESPRLILLVGKKAGETNLLLLNNQGETIHEYIVVVVPEADRHVTVHRSSDGVTTLSCDPTCVGVKNPGLEASERKAPAKPEAPSSGKSGGGTPGTAGAPAESQPKAAAGEPAKSSMPSGSY